MSERPRLLVTHREGVTELRLNRPEVRNAVDDALRDALIDAVDSAAASAETRVLILTGEGSAFCAGGDVSGMRERLRRPPGQAALAGWRRLRHSERLMTSLHDLDKITIAAVNGPAAGFGMDLALACDFIVAADSAFFAMSYVLRGLVPDGGGMYFLPRRVGLARAKELTFSGRRVPAEEALRIGLADRVVPAGELDRAVADWAGELAKSPPTAVALAKSILNRSFELSARDAFALSAEATAICYTSDDHLKLVEEFLDKAPKAAPRREAKRRPKAR